MLRSALSETTLGRVHRGPDDDDDDDDDDDNDGGDDIVQVTSSLLLSSVKSSDAGVYQCVVSNVVATVYSTRATVSVSGN